MDSNEPVEAPDFEILGNIDSLALGGGSEVDDGLNNSAPNPSNWVDGLGLPGGILPSP